MTQYCVSSATGDNSDGTTWAKAYTSITSALSGKVSGDVLIVDSAHAVTATAAITWTPPAGNISIICVTPDGASGFSAFATGAAESVGAASAAFTIASAANAHIFVYGMTLNGGTNANSACTIALLSTSSVCSLEMQSCTFDLKAASTVGLLLGLNGSAGTSHTIRHKNCTYIASGSRAGTMIQIGAALIDIINPTISTTGATKPAILFGPLGSAATNGGNLVVRDGDLSGYAVASSAYIGLGANNLKISILFKNLKLSATPTLTSGSWSQGDSSITLRNVDSADTIDTFQYQNSLGTLTIDNTKYVTAGASFNSAGISWKIVTTTLATAYRPFVTPQLQLWGTSTSAETATVEIIQDAAAAALTDQEIWLGTDSAASASFPNGNFTSDRNAQPIIGTGVDQATSTTAWTGSFTTPTKQKLENAITPAAVGPVTGQVYVSKASATLWLDAMMSGLT